MNISFKNDHVCSTLLCVSKKHYCLEIQFGLYICRGYDRGGGGRGRGRFNWGSEGGGRGRGRGGPPERGNWRGGGARGRGSFGFTSSSLSKEDLDSEMDAYMAQTKGGLDKEIDSYMNRFAHSQAISSGIKFKILSEKLLPAFLQMATKIEIFS